MVLMYRIRIFGMENVFYSGWTNHSLVNYEEHPSNACLWLLRNHYYILGRVPCSQEIGSALEFDWKRQGSYS